MNWNLGRISKVSNGLMALALGLLLTSAASASPRGTEQVAAGLAVENQNVTWEKFLIKGEPQPTFRFAVGHHHATTACYGYLYISREEIWYEVRTPESDHPHEFRYPLATLTDARQWKFLGATKPEAELKFSQGKTYHFFRIPESLLDDLDLEHHKLKADDMLSWQPIVQAAENFDETVRLAEDGQTATARETAPAVTQKPEPSTVDKVAQPPTPVDNVTQQPGDADNVTQQPSAADHVTQPPPTVDNVTRQPSNADKVTLQPGAADHVTQPPAAVDNVTQQPGDVDKAIQSPPAAPPPAAPPTIVLVEPSVESSGQTLEVTNSALTVRGVAVDNSGIPAVTINGTPAAVRPKSAQTVEFTSDPIVLQPGENRIEVSASDAAHAEAKVVFIARYTPPPAGEKAQQPAQSIAKALTKADILSLLKSDLSSAQVTAAVRENGIRFLPTEKDLKEIRAAGGGDDLVNALREAAPPLKP